MHPDETDAILRFCHAEGLYRVHVNIPEKTAQVYFARFHDKELHSFESLGVFPVNKVLWLYEKDNYDSATVIYSFREQIYQNVPEYKALMQRKRHIMDLELDMGMQTRKYKRCRIQGRSFRIYFERFEQTCDKASFEHCHAMALYIIDDSTHREIHREEFGCDNFDEGIRRFYRICARPQDVIMQSYL